MSMTRRVFLRNGALAAVGTAALPSFLSRAALGAVDSAGTGNKRLVVIFQRGAADGLNIVVPHGEPAYYAMRPSINIPRKAVIDLDGFFGLHPSMSGLQPLWKDRHLAIVHAAGSPDPTRSHFDAQDFMESGTPGIKATDDGWLNRSLRALPENSPFRAIALGPSLPRILSGSEPAVAMNNINDFAVGGRNAGAAPIANTFEAMYNQSVDTVLHGSGRETFDAVKMLKSANVADYKPGRGANYPNGRFAESLKQLAQLIKANLGVQVAFADIGGWDHHVNEGSTQGQIANILGEFSGSLAAFWNDLGPLADETVIVTMSEFGRTARENGNRGTDHGHANVMFIMGGQVKGGKVYGRWPGLDASQLYDGRDLAVTTDFRRVLGEAVSRHLGNTNLNTVFPGFDNRPERFLNFVG
jgi:uncharacterized protein (DUF1501 family)